MHSLCIAFPAVTGPLPVMASVFPRRPGHYTGCTQPTDNRFLQSQLCFKQQNREEPGKLLFIQEVKTTRLKDFFRFVVWQWSQVLEKQQYPG